jgi:hypothetical protein
VLLLSFLGSWSSSKLRRKAISKMVKSQILTRSFARYNEVIVMCVIRYSDYVARLETLIIDLIPFCSTVLLVCAEFLTMTLNLRLYGGLFRLQTKLFRRGANFEVVYNL